MRRSAAKAVTALLAASFMALWGLAVPAKAGDRAQLDLIGYSEDGRYFAFEEYGIQDGSGFAYSSIYIIDLVKDAWVSGTPFSGQAEGEEIALVDTRAKVRGLAQAELDRLAITVAAEMVAMNGDGVPENDADALRFGAPGYLPGMVIGDYTLSVSTFAAPSPMPCKDWLENKPLGYELTLSGDGDTRVVHRDTNLPRSRGCPSGYRIYGVAMTPYVGFASAVALVSLYRFGFEGPDRRFLAVPLAP
jgi:predicted secreted protein